MSESKNVTVLVIDENNTKTIKIRKGFVKNFYLIVIGITVLFISLISILFFFIYSYMNILYVVKENQKLEIDNYELKQKITNLNEAIENEIGDRIDELDKSQKVIDSIKKYLKNKGVNVDTKLQALAKKDSPNGILNVSIKNTNDLTATKQIYTEEQLTFLLKTISKVPLGYPHIGRISSPFGYRIHPVTKERGTLHKGIDFKGPIGAPVKVTADGVVTFAGTQSGYGRIIVVQHGFGYSTAYAHLSKINVTKNQTVKSGQVIGKLGNSGRSTGPHLHYEVRSANVQINPNTFLSMEK